MTRGNERREIFLDDDDRRDLLERLDRLIPDWGGNCFAWSLMPNHTHLVVQTGSVPLSKLMHRLNTGFAGRFNRKHHRVGHLFQNRFKSVPIEDDAALMNAVRYVHLNPLRSRQVADLHGLARHPWTGHAALVGTRAPYEFESVERSLTLFDENTVSARRVLLEWMEAAPDVVRGADHEARAPDCFVALDRSGRKPSRFADPVVDTLIDEVCRFFATSPAALRAGGRHARESAARAVIAYVCFRHLQRSMAGIARSVGISRQSVRAAIERGAAIDAELGPFRPREET
jgi:REP element-mobilizing transposase RayT